MFRYRKFKVQSIGQLITDPFSAAMLSLSFDLSLYLPATTPTDTSSYHIFKLRFRYFHLFAICFKREQNKSNYKKYK